MSTSEEFYKVLIVDDEPILRSGMRSLCQWNEHRIDIVGEAANGQEAVEMIEVLRPHLVITDIVMPIMDGIQLAKIIHHRYPAIKVIVLSSFSEYNYMREAFKLGIKDYLLKPKIKPGELITLIHHLCKDMPPLEPIPLDEPPMEIILNQYLSMSCSKDTPIPKALHHFFNKGCFILLACNAYTLLSYGQTTQGRLETYFMNKTEVFLSSCKYRCFFIQHTCYILLNYDNCHHDKVLTEVSTMTEAVHDAYEALCFVASYEFFQLKDCINTYTRVGSYLDKTLYFNQACIHEGRFKTSDQKVVLNIAKLSNRLQALDFKGVEGILRDLYDRIALHQAYDGYGLKRFTQNLIYTIINTFEQRSMTINAIHKSKIRLFRLIDMALTLEAIYAILQSFLQEVEEVIVSHPKEESTILDLVYHYVDKYYKEELTLDHIAGAVHLNYSYLSSYFKQHTGQNLTGYINHVRVEKAKNLLLHSSLSISTISQQVGFSEHNYFTKVFKKIVGQTPAKYRKYNIGRD